MKLRPSSPLDSFKSGFTRRRLLADAAKAIAAASALMPPNVQRALAQESGSDRSATLNTLSC